MGSVQDVASARDIDDVMGSSQATKPAHSMGSAQTVDSAHAMESPKAMSSDDKGSAHAMGSAQAVESSNARRARAESASLRASGVCRA